MTRGASFPLFFFSFSLFLFVPFSSYLEACAATTYFFHYSIFYLLLSRGRLSSNTPSSTSVCSLICLHHGSSTCSRKYQDHSNTGLRAL
ncbi:hypothetical protein QBC33DRAFT_527546 [Phialemonium atrogriseum]|uniref:Uncharacterized protein n=1 Tax=Phialemonium atrogriseum TaxID=1093897 RepID=A0AAJ0FJU0_9PEZI|nr:uncharacterized protein QBC33DRAFT_527546 [Phialemonium atrogriseum]KAK1770307.1 hypothetical protein QBC33DRAFT_527546 [Phialemonium atrogriseum]